MELKRFRKNNKRIIMIIIAVATLIGLVVSITRVMSHAYFKTTKSFNIIQGKIPNPGDVKLAILVGNEKTNTFPNKQDYKYVETKCNEDSHANISFDPNTWKLNIDGIDSKTICTIKFERKTEYEEEILKGSYPVIKDGLVPVTIADNGVVTKADIKEEWYSYENSRWANAVILTGADNYQAGDTIPEDNIESYFVWIPKYRYKLFNVEGNEIPEQEIEIEIGDYNTKDADTECIAPNISGDIGTCSNGKWMTHPAFQSIDDSSDNSKIKGIWVGKFETTGTIDNLTVKPNKTVSISGNMSAFHYYGYNYKRALDSHIIKSTEWGTMAYFTNSKYGRGNTEVWVNNSSSFTTGCAGDSSSASSYDGCQYTWNTANGHHASTTNDISGIYDTSGGAWEVVMGNYNNLGSASGWSDDQVNAFSNKYIDRYTGDNVSYKILGDATGETDKWYSKWSSPFISTDAPWMSRGGASDLSSWISFYYRSKYNGNSSNMSFRLVLSPTN